MLHVFTTYKMETTWTTKPLFTTHTFTTNPKIARSQKYFIFV